MKQETQGHSPGGRCRCSFGLPDVIATLYSKLWDLRGYDGTLRRVLCEIAGILGIKGLIVRAGQEGVTIRYLRRSAREVEKWLMKVEKEISEEIRRQRQESGSQPAVFAKIEKSRS